MGTSHWVVRIGQRETGPLTTEELRRWASQGRILPDSSVCQLESGVWQPASSVPHLFESQPLHQSRSTETAVHDAPFSLARGHHKKSGHGGRLHTRRIATIVAGLCAIGLAMVVMVALVALDRPGALEPGKDRWEQIADGMSRQQVESILGAGDLIDERIEQIGASSVRIEILQWPPNDGHQRLRIELADGKVVSKTLDEL